MPKLRTSILALAATATLGVGGIAIAAPPADAWEIGPIIKGRSYSPGMPTRPYATPQGASFDIPTSPRSHVHYVTLPVRSLEGARRITLRYRVDAPRGTRFIPQESPDRAALISLYFQRRGDSWSPQHKDYRWYSPNKRVKRISPGVHEISIGLDEPWIAMMGGDNRRNPRGFAEAVRNAHRVGFTFGAEGGRGHGVYATRPATFTVLDFRIE